MIDLTALLKHAAYRDILTELTRSVAYDEEDYLGIAWANCADCDDEITDPDYDGDDDPFPSHLKVGMRCPTCDAALCLKCERRHYYTGFLVHTPEATRVA